MIPNGSLNERCEEVRRATADRLKVAEDNTLLPDAMRDRAANLRYDIETAFDSLLEQESRDTLLAFLDTIMPATMFFAEVIEENNRIIARNQEDLHHLKAVLKHLEGENR